MHITARRVGFLTKILSTFWTLSATSNPVVGKKSISQRKVFNVWIVVSVLSYGAKLPPSPAGRWARGSFAPEPARWTAEPASRTGRRGRVHRPDSARLSQGMHASPLTLLPIAPRSRPELPLGAIPLAAGYLALSSSQGYTSSTLNAVESLG